MNSDSSYKLPKGRKVEVITSAQRRRIWAPAEKKQMVEGTFESEHTVSYVARELKKLKSLKKLFRSVAKKNLSRANRCPESKT